MLFPASPDASDDSRLCRGDTGWWFIGYNGTEGWAPADFVGPKGGGNDVAPLNNGKSGKILSDFVADGDDQVTLGSCSS